MYESTAKLKLADIGDGIPNSNLFKNFDVFASANKIAAEIEVLKSSDLLKKTLSNVNLNIELYRTGSIGSKELYNDSPIEIKILKPSEGMMDKRFQMVISDKHHFRISEAKTTLIEGELNRTFECRGGVFMLATNDKVINQKTNIKIDDNYEFEILSEHKLEDKILKDLDIVAVDKDVPVIRINLKSNVPEKAADFVNTLAQTYIYDYIENKYKAANTTVNFLNEQIKDANTKLTSSENTIESYRNENNIVNIRQETETDLRKLSQLKIQQTNIKMNLEAIEELNRYINQGKDNFLALAPNFEAFTDLLSTEIIKNIKKLQSEKKDLLLTYTSNDEKVKVIDDKINDLTTYLVESIKNTKTNLQIKYDQLTNDINEAEQVFVTVPEKEKKMAIMNRDFNLLESSYNFLNEKKIEAEIAQAAKISFHRVITPAVASSHPISPNRPIIIILAAILGMMFSIAVIYTVHFLKAKVNDISSIERHSDIPVAISTPYVNQNMEPVFEKNFLQLELKNIISKGKILAFTSFNAGEGTLFNLVNLCKIVSRNHATVVIADLKNNLDFLKTNYIEEKGLYGTLIPGVFYYDIHKYCSQSISGEIIQNHLNEIQTKADYVFINNEYMSEESRALLVMHYAHQNLFIVDCRKTPLKKTERIQQLKTEFSIQNIHFLVNKVGYNPNVISDINTWIKKLLKKRS